MGHVRKAPGAVSVYLFVFEFIKRMDASCRVRTKELKAFLENALSAKSQRRLGNLVTLTRNTLVCPSVPPPYPPRIFRLQFLYASIPGHFLRLQCAYSSDFRVQEKKTSRQWLSQMTSLRCDANMSLRSISEVNTPVRRYQKQSERIKPSQLVRKLGIDVMDFPT